MREQSFSAQAIVAVGLDFTSINMRLDFPVVSAIASVYTSRRQADSHLEHRYIYFLIKIIR